MSVFRTLIVTTLLCVEAMTVFTQINGERTDSYPAGFSIVSDTNFVVFGTSNQLASSQMGYVAMHDSLGNLLWSIVLGDSLNDLLKGVLVKDSVMYSIGTSWVYGQDNPDFSVTKISNDGIEIWSKTYGSLLYDVGELISNYGNEAMLIGGMTNSFGTLMESILVIKLQGNGLVDWAKVYGDNGIDHVKQVKVLDNGKIVIVGQTSSAALGEEDALMIMLDSLGEIEWTRVYGGAENDAFSDVIEYNGYYYCVGFTESVGFGNKDLWVTKIDDNGNWIWSKIVGDWLHEKGTTVVAGNNNDILIGGYKQSVSGSVDDMIYVSISENGTMNYNYSIRVPNQEYTTLIDVADKIFVGGPALDSIWNIQLYILDSLNMVCDSTESTLLIGDASITAFPLFWSAQDVTNQINTQTHSGMVTPIDSLVIPLNVCYNRSEMQDTNVVDTLGIDYLSNNQILIYPNPNTGNFSILGLGTENTTITLIDIRGKTVVKEKLLSDKLIIENLCKGTYFIRVMNKKVIITKKIVVL
ncbi:MAG: T9SS type A sorting domain-containing protein [Flavobacteriales bacterium]|nr:T9SS type A sorting domain-containing protein [Flavobacteriales bacterium]